MPEGGGRGGWGRGRYRRGGAAQRGYRRGSVYTLLDLVPMTRGWCPSQPHRDVSVYTLLDLVPWQGRALGLGLERGSADGRTRGGAAGAPRSPIDSPCECEHNNPIP